MITLIGMGLVFALICVLWLLMALLTRLTAEPLPPPTPAPAADIDSERELRRRAAAVAVAVALAIGQEPVASPPPYDPDSAWRSLMRARQIKQPGGRQ
jgi:Na+-transporting methylmalonyl-CoA/oxaloacetate decarboxylase gamma subunit